MWFITLFSSLATSLTTKLATDSAALLSEWLELQADELLTESSSVELTQNQYRCMVMSIEIL